MNDRQASNDTPSAPVRVSVPLGERSYDILIGAGLLNRAGETLAPLLKGKRAFIVTDENVGPLHGETLTRALGAAGVACHLITLPAGEATKCFAEIERLTLRLLELGLERSDVLIALGGGVIGDLTGFAAAIALRGVDFVQIPTTLLAQVDSSVGGKTAIDTPFGKNTVGAFHQPRRVLIDTSALDTLPMREVRGGYAEIVKYGFIRDRAFFLWLDANAAALMAGDAAARAHAIERSCAIKAEIVGADEREAGERALLNFGHTFGHALESATGFSHALIHGEAVALGMLMAAALSAQLGQCSAAEVETMRAHYRKAGLPLRPADLGLNQRFDPAALLGHMRHDKKVRGGRITLILLKGIGNAFVTSEVDDAAILSFLTDHLK